MPAPSTGIIDWTGGPAKWAAVGVLAAVSIGGMAWSMLGRVPRPDLVETPVRTPSPVPDPADNPAESSPLPETPAAPAAPLKPRATKPAAPLTHRININTALGPELELLPEIGPALAARIIDDRTRNGPFESVDQLTRVKGIGVKTLAKLRDFATVGEP